MSLNDPDESFYWIFIQDWFTSILLLPDKVRIPLWKTVVFCSIYRNIAWQSFQEHGVQMKLFV